MSSKSAVVASILSGVAGIAIGAFGTRVAIPPSVKEIYVCAAKNGTTVISVERAGLMRYQNGIIYDGDSIRLEFNHFQFPQAFTKDGKPYPRTTRYPLEKGSNTAEVSLLGTNTSKEFAKRQCAAIPDAPSTSSPANE